MEILPNGGALMRRSRVLRSAWILLSVAAAPLGAAACAAQNAPAAPSPGVEGARFLSLLPEVAAHALEGTQRSRELAVDLLSFQGGAVLFARAELSRDQIAAAFGRPVRDVGRAAVRAGELFPGTVQLALDAMIDMGAYVEVTATVSWPQTGTGTRRPESARCGSCSSARPTATASNPSGPWEFGDHLALAE